MIRDCILKKLFTLFLLCLGLHPASSVAAEIGQTPDERVKMLGIVIPEMPAPAGNYRPFMINDDLIYISQIPLKNGQVLNPGALNSADDVARGQEAAQQTILNVLSVVKNACGGTLNCIEQIIRLDGYVASTDKFFDQAKVMNGASDLLVKILGDKGLHARSAVGSIALPLNSSVEISAIIKIKRVKS
jgi:NAD(P)H dehydrogenase (quinone)